REGGALDARFLAVLPLHQLDLVAVLLGPAQVHAEEHLGPVLRLGAAGAGMAFLSSSGPASLSSSSSLVRSAVSRSRNLSMSASATPSSSSSRQTASS